MKKFWKQEKRDTLKKEHRGEEESLSEEEKKLEIAEEKDVGALK